MKAVKLKNVDLYVYIDDFTYDLLATNPYFTRANTLAHLKWEKGRVWIKTPMRKGGFCMSKRLHIMLAAEFLITQRKNASQHYVLFKDGNPLNCTFQNLIWCTKRQKQVWNSLRTDTITGLPGVRYQDGKYMVKIKKNGKRVCLGTFADKETASKVWKAAMRWMYDIYWLDNDE